MGERAEHLGQLLDERSEAGELDVGGYLQWS